MYDQFYQFQGRPFQLTPDPHFYFESGTHRKALSYLGYGLAQGEGFIVITGEIGAGKTTLVGHVMNTIDPARLTAIKIVSTQVQGDDMLRLVALGFGITDEHLPKAQMLQRIEAFLHAQARKGLRTLLIVDEAQNLPPSSVEELRMLSNFQLGGQALLQIFLLGQPEFRHLLNAPEMEQLRQRVIASHHLEPMLESEIEPYIRHRLALVGWQEKPFFPADAFDAVYRATDGIPRRVNALMSRVLLLGAVDQLEEIDGQAIDTVAADMGHDEEAGDRDAASVSADAPAAAATAASPAGTMADELAELRRSIGSPGDLSADQRDLADRLDSVMGRLAQLERQNEEQEAALRRVLTLLVDWVEADTQPARAA
ncbi:MAG: XrtA/PEP-CTERM system-associated ATPase [Sphingobium sp.]